MPAIEDNGAEIAAILNGAGFQIPTDAQFTQFQTALGWGDHGAAGYLTSAPVDSVAGLTGAITDAALRTALNVEDGATADQTGAEIKAAYEGEPDTNPLTDALLSKLNGIEATATADQTGAQIKAAYEAEADTNAFDDAAVTKLAGIAAGAEANTIDSNPAGITGATQVTNVVSISQADYDAIGTPDASTLYVISG